MSRISFESVMQEIRIKRYKDIATKYNLLISGGSDFHGIIVKPDVL